MKNQFLAGTQNQGGGAFGESFLIRPTMFGIGDNRNECGMGQCGMFCGMGGNGPRTT